MKYPVFLITLVMLTACGSQKKMDETSTSPVPPPPPKVVDSGSDQTRMDTLVITEVPVYRASNTILTDLVHTRLDVNFNWAQSRMNGKATITAKPHFYPSDSLILDAKGMDINSVKMNGNELEYTYDSLKLRIKLDKTYDRNTKYTVVIDYVAKPDERETGGSSAITSDKGLYFINPRGENPNQMPQIWTQGETQSNSVWFPTIDSPNSKTTEEIHITVDKKYKTLSNGTLVSSKVNADGTRTDTWKQDLPHAPYLFMMGVGEFKVVKDTYTRPDGSKMDVNYYVEPEWESYAKDIFGETPDMIAYFSKLMQVEYPWDKYDQIVVREYVSGAMENTSAVVFGDFVYQTDRELLDSDNNSTIAHELFHHWFGDLVTCESWSNLPLNESFANYSQYLWDEHRYGLDEAAYNAQKEMDGYFQSAAAQGYHDLIWFTYDEREQMFDGHSYNKGGRILHMLRCYLGDEAFFQGMHNYLVENKFKPAEFHQLRLAFEAVCGEDLNWFFNQWFLGSGHPDLEVRYDNITDSVSISVSQLQDLEKFPLFKLPVDVVTYDDNGKHVSRIVIDESAQSFTLPVAGTLKGIVFDDRQMLLGTISEKKPASYYVYQYYNHPAYRVRLEGLMQGSREREADAGQKLVLAALEDPFWDIRNTAIDKMVRLTGEYKTTGINLIRNMAMNDSSSSVRAKAITFLADRNLPEAELKAMLETVFAKERSYHVLTAALKALAEVDSKAALTRADNLLKEDPSSQLLVGISQLYSKYGSDDKATFFRETLRSGNLKGFDELSILNAYVIFCVEHPDQLGACVEDLAYLKENGGMYTKMFLSQFTDGLTKRLQSEIADNKLEIETLEKAEDLGKVNELNEENAYYEGIIEELKKL